MLQKSKKGFSQRRKKKVTAKLAKLCAKSRKKGKKGKKLSETLRMTWRSFAVKYLTWSSFAVKYMAWRTFYAVLIALPFYCLQFLASVDRQIGLMERIIVGWHVHA